MRILPRQVAIGILEINASGQLRILSRQWKLLELHPILLICHSVCSPHELDPARSCTQKCRHGCHQNNSHSSRVRNSATYPNLGAVWGTNAEAEARAAAKRTTFMIKIISVENELNGMVALLTRTRTNLRLACSKQRLFLLSTMAWRPSSAADVGDLFSISYIVVDEIYYFYFSLYITSTWSILEG